MENRARNNTQVTHPDTNQPNSDTNQPNPHNTMFVRTMLLKTTRRRAPLLRGWARARGCMVSDQETDMRPIVLKRRLPLCISQVRTELKKKKSMPTTQDRQTDKYNNISSLLLRWYSCITITTTTTTTIIVTVVVCLLPRES